MTALHEERWHVGGEADQDLLVLDENGLVVATVVRAHESFGKEGERQQLATAELLAAAPELLAACKAALPFLEAFELEGEASAAGALQQIHAAIATAEGRSP